MSTTRHARRSQGYYCGHCEGVVSKRTFYYHKRTYYDKRLKKWSKTQVFSRGYDISSSFDDSSNESDQEDINDQCLVEEHCSQSPGGIMDEGPAIIHAKSIESDEDLTIDQSKSDEDSAIIQVQAIDQSKSDEEENDEIADDGAPELLLDEFNDVEIECRSTPLSSTQADHEKVHTTQQTPASVALVKLYSFFLLMFQSVFKISDTAMNVLFAFFSMFLVVANPSLNEFISQLPKSTKAARNCQTTQTSFTKYVCCRACHSIYPWEYCTKDDELIQRLCTFQRFPRHTQAQHRRCCDEPLMKTVKSSNGKISYRPWLIYCYKSIIESLRDMLAKPGFVDKCEEWRKRPQNGLYSDIYDGEIWKEFLEYDGVPFLSQPFNFAFHLNVDWFQPFKRTRHSEGAVYLSILNLPRELRFLKEYVFLVGVIPGPHEPELLTNSFLQPLVDELEKLWCGVILPTADGYPAMVRGALLCVGCDIPAARKVCGFLGHRATMGCSKCLLPFPTEHFGEKADYSNFDRTQWEPRTNALHRKEAEKWFALRTRNDQLDNERRTGVRYSCLIQLPYFDAPRMCVVDPMHNLLLGTAKMMVELWQSLGKLNVKQFDEIQARVDSFICPSDLGRIPSKISSSFSGFTAEQWKNWTLYFSSFALKGILHWKDYDCWLLFVKACSLLCKRTIGGPEAKEGDELLSEFCHRFVHLYGGDKCTMNMHLHGHLVQCIKDYGPVYSFWCFSYERLNGVLGSYPTNNHCISVQLAQRFLDYKLFAPDNWPPEHIQQFIPLLKKDYNKGSLMQTTIEAKLQDQVQPLPPVKERAFLSWELEILGKVLNCERVLRLYRCCRAIVSGDKEHILGAEKSRHSRSSMVLAKRLDSDDVALASISFFAECKYVASGKQHALWVAAVSWFVPHSAKAWFGKPTQVWSRFSEPGHSYLPLTNIMSRVVYTKATVNFGRRIGCDEVYVVVPLSL